MGGGCQIQCTERLSTPSARFPVTTVTLGELALYSLDSRARKADFISGQIQGARLLVSVKPEDTHFEVGGPFFLVLSTFPSLSVDSRACDTVRKVHLVFVPSSWHAVPKTLGICAGMRECLSVKGLLGQGM